MTKPQVRQVFSAYGNLEEIFLGRPSSAEQVATYAICHYVTAEDAAEACELDGFAVEALHHTYTYESCFLLVIVRHFLPRASSRSHSLLFSLFFLVCVCVCVCVHVFVCACVHECMCLCMSVCMHVCVTIHSCVGV